LYQVFTVLESHAIALQLARQVAHWRAAAQRLRKIDELADPDAWRALERDTGVALRRNLKSSLQTLMANAVRMEAYLPQEGEVVNLQRLATEIVSFRKHYLQTETILDFYTDCVRSRTNPTTAALLRACDRLASLSMAQVLESLGRRTPPVLCYADAGLGASILKAGLRLWDGRTSSSVAAIKVARQNLPRPTNVIHETGHQVAHILGWSEELTEAIDAALPANNALVWAGWASEMAADAYAFVHTGYAAVTGLHDVVSGGSEFVFRYAPFDPHPISYLRVLIGVEMCRQVYDKGPWDEMALAWKALHPLAMAPKSSKDLIERLVGDIPYVTHLLIQTPMAVFRGRPLSALVDPMDVAPSNLEHLARIAGPALYSKPYWLQKEALRTLALSGWQLAIHPEKSASITARQMEWMQRLGGGFDLSTSRSTEAIPALI
jgi:hypothetical protein